MKIYASDSNLSIEEQLQILRQCAEQHLWVRCYDLVAKMFGSGIMYICPQVVPEYSGNGDNLAVVCKYIRAKDSEIPVSGFDYRAGKFFIGTNFVVAEPLTTFTKEELFGLDTENSRNTFMRFEGKDVWVLVSGPNIGWLYIKVIDTSDPEVLYANTIPDDCVHFEEGSFSEYCPSEMFEEEFIPWSEVQLYHPIDILTDVEILELLNESDEIYENQDME